MKNVFFLLSVLLLITSCSQSITDKDINKIEGYWEIEKVILKDGEKKDYKINETIDYFELQHPKDSEQSKNKWVGFRQKVMPKFNGVYETNNLKEDIVIKNENGQYFINYTTKYGKWKEEIIEVKDSTLVLVNSDELEYHYKKQIPFSIK